MTIKTTAIEVQLLIAQAKQRLAMQGQKQQVLMARTISATLRSTPSCGFLDRPEFLLHPNLTNRKD